MITEERKQEIREVSQELRFEFNYGLTRRFPDQDILALMDFILELTSPEASTVVAEREARRAIDAMPTVIGQEMIRLLRWFEREKTANRIPAIKGYDEIVNDFLSTKPFAGEDEKGDLKT